MINSGAANNMFPEKSVAHRWQDFRLTCVELAIRGGAQGNTIVELATAIGAYIITKSEIELKTPAEGEESSER